MHNNGEFDGVFWLNLEPLVDGSKSSFELSGIIILRLFFLGWEFSILSSIVSSFISLISFIFEGNIFMVFAGFIIFGWSFWENLYCPWFWFCSGEKSSKKSIGNVFLLTVFMLVNL